MRITRRTFLKGAGAASAVLAADQLLSRPAALRAAEGAAAPAEEWVPTTCWIGKQDCGIMARRVGGRVVKLEGHPANPRNLGALCPKGQAQIISLYDPNRVKAPLVRTNAKGGHGAWRRATWDEALDLVAERIRAARVKDPSLVVWQKGRSKSKQLYDEALVEALGATKVTHGAFCSDAGYRALEYTIGVQGVLNPDLRYTSYLLSWGWNIAGAGGNQLCFITWQRQLLEARERGLETVVIDPRIRPAGPFADRWLPIKPGTDLALALALAHELVALGAVDRDYLVRFTNAPYLVGEDGYLLRDGGRPLVVDEGSGEVVPAGAPGLRPALEGGARVGDRRGRTAFSIFRDHVRGATPEWAAAICDVPAEEIRAVARGMAEHAMIGSTIVVDGVELPHRPVGVMMYHAAQQELGFQAVRAIVQVLMLLGAVGAVGGVQMSSKWEIHDNYFALDEVEISDGPYDYLLKGSKYFPINTGNPALGARTMLEPDRYDVAKTPEVLIVHMSNLAVSYPDSPAIQAAYARVPFTVVISPWLSETADLLADVVLPAATLEKYEGPLSASDAYLDAATLRVPPMDPLFGSRGEIDIYLDLCERVGVLYGKGGYLDHVNEGLGLTGDLALPLWRKPTPREIFDRWARAQGIPGGVRYFEENGVYVKGPLPPEARYGYAADPPFGGVVHRFYGESLQRYRDEMRRRGADEVFWRDYAPLPTWRPPTMESSPPEYDLYLVSYKLIEHKQSRTSFVPLLAEIAGRQRLDINPRTARARGIADGQPVVVESHNALTGETRRVTVRARYTEAIRPDVVAMPHGFGLWTHPWARDQGPSPNVLLFTGPGYVTNTADQSFQVKVRVFPAEEA